MAQARTASRRRARPNAPARIEYLRIQSYRALRHVELKDITPLTVLLGPNGVEGTSDGPFAFSTSGGVTDRQ